METNSVLLVQVNLFHVYEIAIDRILGTTFGEVSTIAEENQTVTKLAIEDTLVLSITASRKHKGPRLAKGKPREPRQCLMSACEHTAQEAKLHRRLIERIIPLCVLIDEVYVPHLIKRKCT
jgi:hypothetical protein